ncbi:hypothetical protein LXL04_027733 [Taraxacum kok-saghyz]
MVSRGKADDRWTRVTYRKQKKDDRNGFQRGGSRPKHHVSEKSRSFFFTNFPQSIVANDVWRVCSRMGHVVDVYISPHLSKMGKRFGFVRFVDVKGDQLIVDQLNEVWFGYYKLFASIPRYPKDTVKKNRTTHETQMPSTMHKVKSTVEKINHKGTSYASVLSGKQNEQSPHITKKEVAVLELQSGDFVVDNGAKACLAKARDFATLPNLRLLCMDEV